MAGATAGVRIGVDAGPATLDMVEVRPPGQLRAARRPGVGRRGERRVGARRTRSGAAEELLSCVETSATAGITYLRTDSRDAESAERSVDVRACAAPRTR